jgi:hypothetical protein
MVFGGAESAAPWRKCSRNSFPVLILRQLCLASIDDHGDSRRPSGPNRAPTANPDNDGWDNGIELVIGSNPNTAATAGTPGAITAGGNLVFTFKRSDESEAFALYVEHSTTLDAPWIAISRSSRCHHWAASHGR